jgi:NADPH-dependent 2,4-dienoyl-CoA reductase/sulfur reductase-like enzyme
MNESHRDFDVVVVGAGPAGIAAACAASGSGKHVALLDESPWLGGQIWRGQNTTKNKQAAFWLGKLQRSGVSVIGSTSVVAEAEGGVLLCDSPAGPKTIGWRALVLAVGARELFLPFPGWTLPSVFGVGALQVLAKAGWPIQGRRVVIGGTGPLLLAVAHGLAQAGAQVLMVAEQAPWSRVAAFAGSLARHPSKLVQAVALKTKLLGVPYRCGTWITRAEGDHALRRACLTDGKRSWSIDCDDLACAYGLVPNTELPSLLGCRIEQGFVHVGTFQETSRKGVYCAGETTGIGGHEAAAVEGTIAGLAAAGLETNTATFFRDRERNQRFQSALKRAFALSPTLSRLSEPNTIVCRCEDVDYDRLKARTSWREAKLQTRCGMGACQGRICGAATQVLFGWGNDSARPPVITTRIETLLKAGGSLEINRPLGGALIS